jgi:hypothetical protein
MGGTSGTGASPLGSAGTTLGNWFNGYNSNGMASTSMLNGLSAQANQNVLNGAPGL